MTRVDYIVAPDGWDHREPNPFTSDGTYDAGWSCFQILDGPEGTFYSGRGASGLYAAALWSGEPTLADRLADFLRYEAWHARRTIVAGPAGMDVESIVKRALAATPEASVVRRSDPRWAVHSTTRAGWDAIRVCGELRSVAALRDAGHQVSPLGAELLGEPEEYAEYVMLGPIGHASSEIVAASQLEGAMVADENAPYQPGARLYFDCHGIIRAGIAVRDGLHLVKVRERLPLDPHIVAVITPADLGPEGTTREWTPRTFTEAANARFLEHRRGEDTR
jgi:hypothetical protein